MGTKLPNGRLITHATPPGPKAVHRPAMFERDLEFSQAALDHFAEKTGVDYIGEWHKHPPTLTEPSEEDRKGVVEILKDPDYKTGDLMVFPVWVLSHTTDYLQLPFHRALVEYFFWPTEQNIACYPYYMDNTFQFHPFHFQIASCDLGTQGKVSQFYTAYVNCKTFDKTNVGELWNKFTGAVAPSSIDGGGTHSDRPESADSASSCVSNENPQREASHGLLCDKETVEQHKDKNDRWYETAQGKNLLMEEKRTLQSLCSRVGLRMLPTGRLAWRFASPHYRRVFLEVICSHDYPNTFPELYLLHNGKIENIIDFDGRVENREMDWHAYVQGMVKKLKSDWESGRMSPCIGGIVNILGFADLIRE